MDTQLSLSHLGYLPESPKILTLLPGDASGLPDAIPFYLRQNCLRMTRAVGEEKPEAGFSARFPAPYDLLRGKLVAGEGVAPSLPLVKERTAKNLKPLGFHVAGRFQPVPYSRQLPDRNRLANLSTLCHS